MLSHQILFEILRYSGLTWKFIQEWYEGQPIQLNGPSRRYLLSDSSIELQDDMETVPEHAVYIEEWIGPNGEKKCVVRYSGQEIPLIWDETPFDTDIKCPWVWVGDKTTEIDLTRTFNKFLVSGNQIRVELVEKLIHITDKTDLVYIESGTFKELKFPGDGILI